MKYAILSDAHGNRIFFDVCIKAISEVNVHKIVYLGDMFGYMPDGQYIMARLKNMGAMILKGNHEAMLLGELPLDLKKDQVYGLIRQRKMTDSECRTFLSNLKPGLSITSNGKNLLFIHGAPFDFLNGYLYEDDKKYIWNEEQFDYIFMGHTHRPFIKKINKTVFINVGSCGLPRDIGTSPSFCVFDTKTELAEIHRIDLGIDILETEYFLTVNKQVLDVLRRK